jgi:single-stranded DNA-specific DHH superfamily exonuclease
VNRILVKKGLEVMRKNPSCGLKALLELTKTDFRALNEKVLAFVVTPRINAEKGEIYIHVLCCMRLHDKPIGE